MVGLQQIRQVDMLPLLDIILVVLFVFATIEEGEHGDTKQDIEQLQQELAQSQAQNQLLIEQIELLTIPEVSEDTLQELRDEIKELKKKYPVHLNNDALNIIIENK